MSGEKNLGGLLEQQPLPVTDNMLVQQARSAIRAPVLSSPRAQSFVATMDRFGGALDDYSSALADSISALRNERLNPDFDFGSPEEIKIEKPRAQLKKAPLVPRGTTMPRAKPEAPLGELMAQRPVEVPVQAGSKALKGPSFESQLAKVLLGLSKAPQRSPPKKIALPKPRYI